jgi:hypothetical protein
MSGITQEQLLWRIIDKLNEAIHSQHETIEFLMNKRLKQPEWVGLMDEEISNVIPVYCHNEFELNEFRKLAKAIEAKLKENHGG